MTTNDDYIPNEIADFHDFVITLIEVTALHVPGTARPWGYTNTEFEALESDAEAFKDAYDLANPAGKKKSRTPSQTKDMNEKKDVCEKTIRDFVNTWLAYNIAVTNPDKMDMNLTVFDTVPSPVPVPGTKPFVFKLDTSETARHKIQMREEGSTSGGLPEGMNGLEIRSKVGGAAPLTPEECPNQLLPTRASVTINYSTADSGKRVFYYARYLNSKNQPGPWSIMFSAIIP